MNYQQIAEVLNTDVKEVCQRLLEARMQLVSRLKSIEEKQKNHEVGEEVQDTFRESNTVMLELPMQ